MQILGFVAILQVIYLLIDNLLLAIGLVILLEVALEVAQIVPEEVLVVEAAELVEEELLASFRK